MAAAEAVRSPPPRPHRRLGTADAGRRGRVGLPAAAGARPRRRRPSRSTATSSAGGQVNAVAKSGNRVFLGGNFDYAGRTPAAAPCSTPKRRAAAQLAINGTVLAAVARRQRRLLRRRQLHRGRRRPPRRARPPARGRQPRSRLRRRRRQRRRGRRARPGRRHPLRRRHLRLSRWPGPRKPGRDRPHERDRQRWNPGANNPVLAIATSSTAVWVGGESTTIGAQPRNSLARVNAETGVVSPWNPNPNTAVSALAVRATTLYVGGEFSTIGGATRKGLAAIECRLHRCRHRLEPEPRRVRGRPRPGRSRPSTSAATSPTPVVSHARTWPRSTSAPGRRSTGTRAPTAPSSRSPSPATRSTRPVSSPPSPAPAVAPSPRSTRRRAAPWPGTRTRTRSRPSSSPAARPCSPAAASARSAARPGSGSRRFDASSGALTPWNPGANGNVLALAANGGNVYVGGAFTSVGGQGRVAARGDRRRERRPHRLGPGIGRNGAGPPRDRLDRVRRRRLRPRSGPRRGTDQPGGGRAR